MNEKKIQEELIDIVESTDEWLKSIIYNPTFVWGKLNTRDIVEIIEDLLQRSKKCLQLLNGTISLAEKKEIIKFKKEKQEALNDFRREYKI